MERDLKCFTVGFFNEDVVFQGSEGLDRDMARRHGKFCLEGMYWGFARGLVGLLVASQVPYVMHGFVVRVKHHARLPSTEIIVIEMRRMCAESM